jgi:antirestriction protein ArdC
LVRMGFGRCHAAWRADADKITRTETDTTTGEDTERAIPFMKGYTVFNVEQIEGLPDRFYAKPAPKGEGAAHQSRRRVF